MLNYSKAKSIIGSINNIHLLILMFIICPTHLLSQEGKITNEILEAVFNPPGYCGLTPRNSLGPVYFLKPLLYDTKKGKAFLHSKIVHGDNTEKRRAIEILMRGDDEKIDKVLVDIFLADKDSIEVSRMIGFIKSNEVIELLNKELIKTGHSDIGRLHGILQSILYKTDASSISYVQEFINKYEKEDRIKRRARRILNIITNFNENEQSRKSMYAEIINREKPEGYLIDDLRLILRKVKEVNDKSIIPILRARNKEILGDKTYRSKRLVILRYELGDNIFSEVELEIIKEHKRKAIEAKKKFKWAKREVFKRSEEGKSIISTGNKFLNK